MIQSFKNKLAYNIFHGIKQGSSRRFPPDVARRAFIKLFVLHAAESLEELRSPPSNHLEALTGDRMGYHSIRINQQWRLVFRWQKTDAYDVQIVDYH